MTAAVVLLGAFPAAVHAMETKSICRIEKNGHGEGRDLVVVTWRTQSGVEAGEVRVPVTGIGLTGPVSLKLHSMEKVPNHDSWDCREWQWWEDCPFDTNEKRPREISVATGGADLGQGGVRVWSRYVCDQVETTQEWFFADLQRPDVAVYDCLITVRNLTGQRLVEYGQFFASYTALNGHWAQQDSRKGHFYVDEEGSFVNYRDVGSVHLEYYVTARDSPFDRLGFVPHCPRGEGKIKARWKYPVSISRPSRQGYHHIVFSEEARTSAIAQGMEGIAQDYLIYPPGGDLEPDETFVVHVRHLLVKALWDQLPERLARWWDQFTKDHEQAHRLSRPVP